MKKFTSTIILLVMLIATTIKNAGLIPEPVIMILLGAGLISLAVFGRQIFLRKG